MNEWMSERDDPLMKWIFNFINVNSNDVYKFSAIYSDEIHRQ